MQGAGTTPYYSHQGRLLPLHNQQWAGAKASQLHFVT